MVSVFLKDCWLTLFTNVNIISINLTQWISLFRKIWVFTICVNALCISGCNVGRQETANQQVKQIIWKKRGGGGELTANQCCVHDGTEMWNSANAKIGHVQKYKGIISSHCFLKWTDFTKSHLKSGPGRDWWLALTLTQPWSYLIQFQN